MPWSTCGNRFSPFTTRTLGIRLSSPGLAASVFTCCDFSPAQLELLYTRSHYTALAGLGLTMQLSWPQTPNLPASTSQVLGSQV